MFRRIETALASGLKRGLIILFVALVADALLGVFSRYVLGSPFRWTDELATFLLVWLVFLGAAWAYRENGHLGLDFVSEKMDATIRHWNERFVALLVLAFSLGVLVYGGGSLTIERWEVEQMMPTLGIRKAWQYLAVPIGGGLAAFFALAKLLDRREREDRV